MSRRGQSPASRRDGALPKRAQAAAGPVAKVPSLAPGPGHLPAGPPRAAAAVSKASGGPGPMGAAGANIPPMPSRPPPRPPSVGTLHVVDHGVVRPPPPPPDAPPGRDPHEYFQQVRHSELLLQERDEGQPSMPDEDHPDWGFATPGTPMSRSLRSGSINGSLPSEPEAEHPAAPGQQPLPPPPLVTQQPLAVQQVGIPYQTPPLVTQQPLAVQQVGIPEQTPRPAVLRPGIPVKAPPDGIPVKRPPNDPPSPPPGQSASSTGPWPPPPPPGLPPGFVPRPAQGGALLAQPAAFKPPPLAALGWVLHPQGGGTIVAGPRFPQPPEETPERDPGAGGPPRRSRKPGQDPGRRATFS